MPSPNESRLLRSVRSATASALDARAALAADVARQGAEIAELRRAAATAAAAGDARAAAAARARADAAMARRRRVAQRIRAIDDRLAADIGRLIDRADPCDAESDVPLALLPVRLETRFALQGSELRIRIFPDDIHVDQLERGVSSEEDAAGRAYWTSRWDGGDRGAAWLALVAAVGESRASWVAHALTPSNVASLGAADAPPPDFPDPGPRSRRAAVARLLPDRFVAVAVQGDARSTLAGRVIAPELVVGLLSDDGTALVAGADGIVAPEGAEWLFDYDRAVEAGMAITLPLARAGAMVDRLYVVGVRSSLDPARAQAAVEDQLLAHRHGRGLAFVPQGTPTNNTESDRSAWQPRLAPVPPVVGAAPPAAGSNAAALAGALGVDPLALAGIDHAADGEQALARAANVALWSPSWGGLLDKVMVIGKSGPTLTDEIREAARSFFRDHVRGRGPLPAFRVGDQPYGVLPVSSLGERWRVRRGDALGASLHTLLVNIRDRWRAVSGRVPRVADGNPALDATLLELLASTPVMEGLRVRTVFARGVADVAATVTGEPADAAELEVLLERLVWEDLRSASFNGGVSLNGPLASVGSLEKDSRPLPFVLVHESDPSFIASLLAGRPAGIQSVLQALLALAMADARAALDAAAPPHVVGVLAPRATALSDDLRRRIVGLVADAPALPAAELHAGADLVAGAVGESGPSLGAGLSPIPAFRTSIGELALDSTVEATAGRLAAQALGAWLRASAHLAELRDALGVIAAATLEERRIVVAETLDLASHRVDAWLTALVDQRRAELRGQRPTGLIIGAYGWTERIVPGAGGAPDGGWIHAPSLAHATTAGVLRSAYLSHNPDAGGSGAFAIDLGGARVRTALDLIDGMAQGQPIGALVGYRIERWMHDRQLDRFVLSLRAFAPLVGGQISAHGEAVPRAASEAIAANDVLDGVRLAEAFAKDPAPVRAAMDAQPANNVYLAPGDWTPSTVDEWNAMQEVLRDAMAAIDALADLMLAESVHQFAQGNAARAAAVLDASGSGEAPPIEAFVASTPMQGVPFTHRLLIVLTGDGAPWNTTRPRAAASPSLEAWAGARLGDPASVVVHVAADGARTTLDAGALAALDVLYAAGDASRLEREVRAAIPAIPAGEPLALARDPAWPAEARAFGEIAELAASLRALVVAARPALPADLARANDAPARALDAADLAAIDSRLTGARAALAAALAALDAAPDDASRAAALADLGAYGIGLPAGAALDVSARAASAEGARRLALADAARAGGFDGSAAAAIGQALFGDGFWVAPRIAPAPGGDLFQAALDGGTLAAPPARGAIRRFLRDAASVRPAVARYADAQLVGDALGRGGALRVAQLAPPGAEGGGRWVGGALDPTEPTPAEPVTNLVLDAPSAWDGSSAAALVIDQWVDVVPRRERRGEGDAATIDERHVTGLAVNAASASARPPQAILLAVSPDGARWTTDALVDVLADTFDLATIRGVTLERTPGTARIIPALYERSWSLQGEPAIDPRFFATHVEVDAIVPFVKELHP